MAADVAAGDAGVDAVILQSAIISASFSACWMLCTVASMLTTTPRFQAIAGRDAQPGRAAARRRPAPRPPPPSPWRCRCPARRRDPCIPFGRPCRVLPFGPAVGGFAPVVTPAGAPRSRRRGAGRAFHRRAGARGHLLQRARSAPLRATSCRRCRGRAPRAPPRVQLTQPRPDSVQRGPRPMPAANTGARRRYIASTWAELPSGPLRRAGRRLPRRPGWPRTPRPWLLTSRGRCRRRWPQRRGGGAPRAAPPAGRARRGAPRVAHPGHRLEGLARGLQVQREEVARQRGAPRWRGSSPTLLRCHVALEADARGSRTPGRASQPGRADRQQRARHASEQRPRGRRSSGARPGVGRLAAVFSAHSGLPPSGGGHGGLGPSSAASPAGAGTAARS